MKSYEELSRKSENTLNELRKRIKGNDGGKETYRKFLKNSVHPISKKYAEKIIDFNRKTKNEYQNEKAKGIDIKYLQNKIYEQASNIFIEYRNDVLKELEKSKILRKKAIEIYENRQKNENNPIYFRRLELKIKSMTDDELDKYSKEMHLGTPTEDEYLLTKAELLQRNKSVDAFNEISIQQNTTSFWKIIPEGKESIEIDKFFKDFSGNDVYYIDADSKKINNFPIEDLFNFDFKSEHE